MRHSHCRMMAFLGLISLSPCPSPAQQFLRKNLNFTLSSPLRTSGDNASECHCRIGSGCMGTGGNWTCGVRIRAQSCKRHFHSSRIFTMIKCVLTFHTLHTSPGANNNKYSMIWKAFKLIWFRLFIILRLLARPGNRTCRRRSRPSILRQQCLPVLSCSSFSSTKN